MLRTRRVPGTESVVGIISERFLTATTCNTTRWVAFPSGKFCSKKKTTKEQFFPYRKLLNYMGLKKKKKKMIEGDEELILLTNYNTMY